MTWLDLGNHWRNIYLLSCLVQMGALGCLFASQGWFVKKSRLACFFTGVAATPLVQYLWTLLLALVWPQAPRMVYIGVLPALSALTLVVLALRSIRRIKELIAQGISFAKRCLRFDKPALVNGVWLRQPLRHWNPAPTQNLACFVHALCKALVFTGKFLNVVYPGNGNNCISSQMGCDCNRLGFGI